MRLQIAARHMELTEGLRQHVQHRFLDTLPNHYDRDSCDLRVEIDHAVGGASKKRYEEVHAQLAVPGALLVAHARARDAYAAVDAAQKQLLRRLDDWRHKLTERARHPKKYYAAKLAEQGPGPSLIAQGPAVLESGATLWDGPVADQVGKTKPSRMNGISKTRPAFPESGIDAESLAGRSDDESLAPPPSYRTPTELLSLLASRRSVRRFISARIPDELIKVLEDSLSTAPSADNLESRRFYFVRSADLRGQIAACCKSQPFATEAPLLVVCCAHLGSASLNRRRGVEVFAPMDVAAAIENMLIVAHATGLGATWIGDFAEQRVSEILLLPSEIRPLSVIAIGWPAEHPAAPKHLPREEVVHER